MQSTRKERFLCKECEDANHQFLPSLSFFLIFPVEASSCVAGVRAFQVQAVMLLNLQTASDCLCPLKALSSNSSGITWSKSCFPAIQMQLRLEASFCRLFPSAASEVSSWVAFSGRNCLKSHKCWSNGLVRSGRIPQSRCRHPSAPVTSLSLRRKKQAILRCSHLCLKQKPKKGGLRGPISYRLCQWVLCIPAFGILLVYRVLQLYISGEILGFTALLLVYLGLCSRKTANRRIIFYKILLSPLSLRAVLSLCPPECWGHSFQWSYCQCVTRVMQL